MRMNIQGFFVFLLLLILFLSGCNSREDNENHEKVKIMDMYGRSVEVPEKVNKIAGVGPGALRLLVYMDLVSLVSGVEDVELRAGRPYSFAHPELLEKPIIGPYMGGDSELLTMNNPDVIFMAFMSAADADELQERTGIPVVGLKSGNLRNARDTLYRALGLIGQITGREERADTLRSFIEDEIKTLNNRTAKFQSITNAYVGGISYRGTHGIASTQAFFAPFDFVNVTNVAESLMEEEPNDPIGIYVDVEQIITWKPDYLFLDAAGLDQIRPAIASDTPLMQTIEAFARGNVYTLMPHNWYATNFENVLINGLFIGTIAYPEAFRDVNFEKKAREIYRFVLGKDVFDQMKDFYDGWEKL